jgi:malonyl-CoA decarboxylase
MNMSLESPNHLLVRALVESDTDLIALFAARESVIPVQGSSDLERRLATDRRVFALILPDGEVAGFVQVALSRAFPRSLEQILRGPLTHGEPSFATFYGITRISDQMKGRADEMLAAVTNTLLATNPDLSLATLSPIPKLRPWLEAQITARGLTFSGAQIEASSRKFAIGLGDDAFAAAMHDITHHYLHRRDERGRLIDPVARFHLGNGAVCGRIRVGADCSWHGLEQSFGVMASYQYHPKPVRSKDASTISDLDASLNTLEALYSDTE